MIIKSIKLNNIRSYLNEEIRFPDGSFLLSGDIGSGKSTILLAIEFALFGIKRKHLSGTSLLRNGKKEGSVELNFEIEDNDVIIKRALKRTKDDVTQDTGYIIIDGIKKELTANELKTVIFDLLGYPPELLSKSKDLVYRYTVFTPQEEMKHILMEDEEFRLDVLRRVFGIDKYKRVRENEVIFIKKLKEQRNILASKISDLEEKNRLKKERELEICKLNGELDALNPQIEVMKAKLSQQGRELKLIEISIKNLENLKKQLDVNDAKLIEKYEQIRKNNSEITFIETQLKELSKKFESLAVEKPSDKSDEEIEKEIYEKEKMINLLRQKDIILKGKIENLSVKIAELEKSVSDKSVRLKDIVPKKLEFEKLKVGIEEKERLLKRIDLTNLEIMQLNNKIKEFEVYVTQSNHLKDSIKKLNNCPTCRQQVTDSHKHAIDDAENRNIERCNEELKKVSDLKSEKEDFLKEFRKQYDVLLTKEKNFEVLNAEIMMLERINEEIIDNQRLLSKASAEKKEAENELEAVKKQDVKQMAENIEELKRLLKKIQIYNGLLKDRGHIINMMKSKEELKEKLVNSNHELKKNIDDITLEKTKLTLEIEKSKDIEKDYEAMKSELEEIREKHIDLELKKVSFVKEIEGLSRIAASLEAEIIKKISIRENLLRIAELQNWLENYFVNIVSIMEKQVMIKIHQEFNNLFQNWFNMMMEDETINVRLDEQFTPIITQDGYDIDFEHLSGGERTSCALAYRLSLNKVINDVVSNIKTKDIIILDEPTDGFSSEQLDKVRDVLDQLAIKQTIIVSHESKIESFVEHVIRINKNEHVSRVMN